MGMDRGGGVGGFIFVWLGRGWRFWLAFLRTWGCCWAGHIGPCLFVAVSIKRPSRHAYPTKRKAQQGVLFCIHASVIKIITTRTQTSLRAPWSTTQNLCKSRPASSLPPSLPAYTAPRAREAGQPRTHPARRRERSVPNQLPFPGYTPVTRVWPVGTAPYAAAGAAAGAAASALGASAASSVMGSVSSVAAAGAGLAAAAAAA